MTDDRLEREVEAFLERRAAEPSLTPEAFGSEHPDSGAGLVEAIHTALEVEGMFGAASEAPSRIGGYHVLGEIGRGGMGIVYRVERAGESFALKLLPLAPIVGPRMLERFRREVETLGQLSHPNIVRVRDTGMHDEMPFLVMDLIEGRSLHEVADALSTDEAVKLVASLAETLQAAHTRGILHRDLKPQNVLVRPDGTPVLLDFGLSVGDEFPTFTATSEILGTPRYMAPEQVLGRPADARTDVYALGLVLFELITHRPARRQESREALLETVRLGRVPPARSIDRSIPAAVERILLCALARNPARRYPSAQALADDLGRFRRGEPVQARLPHPMVRAAEELAADPVRVRSLAVAAIVVIGVAVGALWWRQSAEPTPEDRRAAGVRLDHATTLWLDGEAQAARIAAREATRLDPAETTARVLLAHLSGKTAPRGGTPCARAAHEALRCYADGAFADAITRIRGCPAGELRPSLVSSVVGLSAARAGDRTAAFDELTTAARLLPRSVELARALARVCVALDRPDDAEQALRRAAELAPGSPAIWVDLAEVYLRKRDLDAGLWSIAKAESLSASEDPRILQVRGTLEVNSGKGVAGRAHLARVLELDPRNVEAAYGIGYSLDLDHDLVGAERAYRRVLEIQPTHVRALVCLANLHAGASRGQCKGCDAAFAAHPEYLDLDKAEGYVLRCIETDRGNTDWVTQSARDIALKLERRTAVIALLERLTASEPSTPAVLRLKDTLRRVRLVEGG